MPLPAAVAAFQIGTSLFSLLGASRAGAQRQRGYDRMAADELARGEEEVQFYQRRVNLLLGQQRTGAAAQGLDVTFGSPKDIATDTAANAALDIGTIRRNAQRAARGLRETGRLEGGAGRTQAYGYGAQAAATLLGMAADPYDRWIGRRRAERSVGAAATSPEWY